MVLSAEHLSFSYKHIPVLEDVSFHLVSGNLVCVLGKNGSGKSTLFKCILGLLNGYGGQIQLDGISIRKRTARELASAIAYIPQTHQNTFAFSVLDMVMMGTTASFSMFTMPGRQQEDAAMEALRTMHMESFAKRSYAHLSGGEQQMVLIARALAQKSRVLIMDEPCANLDYGNQIRVMEQLKALAGQGYLVIQSTHNPEHAFLFADQVMVLDRGKIAVQGSPKKYLTEELLESIYQIPISLYPVPGQNLNICLPRRSLGL